MKIAVNTRFLIKDRLEGIGWFTYQSLKRMTRQHPEHEFFFFFDRPFDESFIFSDNITPVILRPPARHPFLWYWWFEYAVPAALKKIKPDVFLSTDGYLSLKTNVKTLVVMHDLAFENFPGHVSWLPRKYYRYFSPKYAQKAVRIATVSEFSKKDIVKRYAIDPDKIDIIYNGSDEQYVPLNEMEKKKVREEFAQGREYFLFVGSIHPRKNLLGLLKAYELFQQQTNSDMYLMVAGRIAWKAGATMNFYEKMQYKNKVIFTGHCELSKLTKLMGAASVLVYPSYFEGFGIPIAEAMSCDVPVIAADNSSIPEVVGDAGILVDPYSAASICKAMVQVYAQPELRNYLVEKGRQQRGKFDWDITAEKLWHSVEKTIS